MFKKTSAFLLALMLVLTLMPFAPNVMAAEKPITVMLLGNKLSFDTDPVIINDRTMVPLRAIFEALGASVEWDGDTKTVTSVKGDTTVKLTVGENKLTVNGTEKALDVPGQIVENRTLVPVRAISEAFGCEVGWDAETRTVTITK